ncbi:MAG: glycosyltransferase [Chloroflexota bacterium]|nr:glycosyltransferase [Chloroflexota bacterium]
MAMPKAATVAYILKMYPRFSETFILNEILELERQGMALRLYSLKKPDDGRFHADLARVQAPVTYVPESPLIAPRAYLAAHREVFRWSRLRYVRVLVRTLRRRSRGAAKRFLQAGYLAPRLRREGISHVHAHFASSATSVALYLNQLAGISYSFTAHAKDIYSNSVSEEMLRRKLQRARFVVTVSDYNRAHLSRLAGTTPVTRIYNGLDLEQFSPNGIHPADPPLILGVGRLVEKKGFDDLIRACAELRRTGSRFTCRIIGKGSDEAQLHTLVAQLGLEDHVELRGPKPREALLGLYPRAAVVVAPCVVGTDGNRDGLPTVLIEAMALGVPVISTAVTGIPELVEHGRTGYLTAQRDPISLAATIRAVLDDPMSARAHARTGRQRIERDFDIRANVITLRALFEQASAE